MANDFSQLPPHDADAEEAVIGSLLVDGSAIERVAESLSVADFYHERNQWLYKACLSLYQRGTPIDQITLAQDLDSQGKLEACGGTAYLSHLVSIVPTSLDIEHYAAIVHRLALLRQIIEAARQITAKAYDTTRDPNELADEARALLDVTRAGGQKYLELSHLRIIKSDPPHYTINVNGTDLSLSLMELLAWQKFRAKVLAKMDFIPVKPHNWDSLINKLLDMAEKDDAPVDTLPDNETRISVQHFFERLGPGTEQSDIQSGCYAVVHYRGKETSWESKEVYAFQPTPLLRWLKKDLGKNISRDTLWSMMVGWGAIKHQWRIGKSETNIPLRLWALPPDFARAAEYAVEKEERQEGLAASQPSVTTESLDTESLPDF